MNTFASMNSYRYEFITEKRLTEADGEFKVVYFLMLFQTVTR
jgi:hypothetical protein